MAPSTVPPTKATAAPTSAIPTVPEVVASSPGEITAPPTSIIFEQAGCEMAYVYCPGRSTCLSDPSFNNGTTAVADDSLPSCGWSIAYNPQTDGYVKDCAVYTGIQNDCDISKGTKVGEAYINENFAHICLDDTRYQANIFYMYAGQCIGNDNGNQVSQGSCDPAKVSQYARSEDTYPLVNVGGPMTASYTFTGNNTINADVWGSNYRVFPITGTMYMTATTCVAPATGTGTGSMNSKTADDLLAYYAGN
jgi:hypothetical protein